MTNQQDLKTSKMAKSFRHFDCPEDPDFSGKAKFLFDSDGGNGFDNQKNGLTSDLEISSCESAQSTEAERKCVNCNHISFTHCSRANADDSQLSSVISLSNSELKIENHAEATCSVVPGDKNQKDHDSSGSFPRVTDCLYNISMKSDVSSEGCQTLGKEITKLMSRTMNNYRAVVNEDELKAVVLETCHSKQLKAESSSSNSVRVILPASSNDSCQATSVDAKSCENRKGNDIDTSIHTDFKCSMEEPAGKNSSLVMAAQFASEDGLYYTDVSHEKQGYYLHPLKAFDDVGTRDSDKLVDGYPAVFGKGELPKSSVPEKDAEFPKIKPCFEVTQRDARGLEQEVGMHKEASGTCSSVQDKSVETFQLSSVDSAISDNSCFKFHFGNGQGRRGSICSAKDEVNPEMLTPNEEVCLEEAKELQHKVLTEKHKVNVDLHGQLSSPCTTKSEDMSADGRLNSVSGFDLNENILADELDYPEQSMKELISLHEEIVSKPVPVMAKSGVPICLPEYHMQLDGEAGGWRGSAATSAFRPTFPQSINRNKAPSAFDSNNASKGSQVNGIDLNIAAEEGDCDVELLPAVSSFPSEESSADVGLSRAEKFNIDLNCISGNDGTCPQPCLPAPLSRNSAKAFDLNDNPTCEDACSDSCLPAQGIPGLRDRIFGDSMFTVLEKPQQPESNSVGSSYQADLSTMQNLSGGHFKPFLMVAPSIPPKVDQMQSGVSLQQRPTYAAYQSPPSLPPHTLIYNNALFIDPNHHLPSSVYASGVISYNMTNPQMHAFFPHFSAFTGAPHIRQGPGGPDLSGNTIISPSSDPNRRITSSESRSWGENGRQLSVPLNNASTEDQMRHLQLLALSATPQKRREPDGGWDYHHPSVRWMNSRQ